MTEGNGKGAGDGTEFFAVAVIQAGIQAVLRIEATDSKLAAQWVLDLHKEGEAVWAVPDDIGEDRTDSKQAVVVLVKDQPLAVNVLGKWASYRHQQAQRGAGAQRGLVKLPGMG